MKIMNKFCENPKCVCHTDMSTYEKKLTVYTEIIHFEDQSERRYIDYEQNEILIEDKVINFCDSCWNVIEMCKKLQKKEQLK